MIALFNQRCLRMQHFFAGTADSCQELARQQQPAQPEPQQPDEELSAGL